MVHLLIPKVVILSLAHLPTERRSLFIQELLGVQKTILSANSSPQQYSVSIFTLLFKQSLKKSLIDRLKCIGDKGHPCRTPLSILNESEN